MKKYLKRITAILLVVAIMLCGTACGKDETLNVNFDNPFEGKTYSDVIELAEEINRGMIYATPDNNTFEVKSVKAKTFVFSGAAAILSVVTFAASLVVGGFYTTPAVYYAGKGEKVIEVKLKYTNNSAQSVMVGDVTHMVFSKSDENVYDGITCRADAVKLDYSGTKVIDPGKTEEIRLLIDVPKELVKNHDLFEIYFDIEGNVYSLLYIK